MPLSAPFSSAIATPSGPASEWFAKLTFTFQPLGTLTTSFPCEVPSSVGAPLRSNIDATTCRPTVRGEG